MSRPVREIPPARATADRTCPYCRFALEPSDEGRRCPGCDALYHADCWGEHGGCAVASCPGAPPPYPRAVPVAELRGTTQSRHWSRRSWLALGIALLGIGVAAGLLGSALGGNSKKVGAASGSEFDLSAGTARKSGSGQGGGRPPATDPRGAVLGRALHRAVAAARPYGTGEAAVMLDGWGSPLLAGDIAEPVRPWSMVKLVTAVALLDELEQQGVGDPGRSLSPYLQRALERSDNCAQRELIVQLQRVSGSMGAALAQVHETVARAGAGIDTASVQSNGRAVGCVAPGYVGIRPADAREPALLMGTARWTIAAAVRFVQALRSGVYDRSVHAPGVLPVLAPLLRHPKANSAEPAASDITADPSWGMGQAFARPCWRLAYKAGWGSGPTPYLAGQVGWVELSGGHFAVISVFYRPNAAYQARAQARSDDPALVQAPAATAAMLAPIKTALTRISGGCS